MVRRTAAVTAGAASLMLLLPGSAMAGPASSEQAFECDAARICLYDLGDGAGEKKTINIEWEGGFKLAPSGWANRTTSVQNNEEYTLTLLDGEYHDCVILDTVEPGESKTLPASADDRTDLVDWSSGPGSCDPR